MGHGIDPRLEAVAAVLLGWTAGIYPPTMAVDCDRSESRAPDGVSVDRGCQRGRVAEYTDFLNSPVSRYRSNGRGGFR